MKKLLTILSAILITTALSCSGGGGDDSTPPTGFTGTPPKGVNCETGICSFLGVQPKIAGGETCDDLNSPVVLLSLKDTTPRDYCSGVLISNSIVLTAAHCVPFEEEITVTTGRYKTTVSDRFIHPRYELISDSAGNLTDVIYDVAVLYLEDALPIKSFPLMYFEKASANDFGIAYGYGFDENGSLGQFKGGLIPITKIDNEHIYSDYTKGYCSNTCRGDSGGPLVGIKDLPDGTRKFGVIGITSIGNAGVACGDSEQTKYTNIQNDDIARFIRILAEDAKFN